MTINPKTVRRCCMCIMMEITATHDEMLELGWHFKWTFSDVVTVKYYCPKHTRIWEDDYQSELKQINERYGR